VSSPRAAPPLQPAARIVVRGLIVPLAAGALCVFGFAPFYAWPVPIAMLALLFHAWDRALSPRQAALSGFAFGLGFFLGGVSWMYISLHTYGSMPAPLAALAVFLVCAYLALFPAAAGWVAIRWGGTRSGPRLALMCAAFVALEWLRGWLFTGFPWLTLGTSQVPSSPLAGFAPLVGAYGTSLAVLLAAALVTAFFHSLALSRERYLLLGALAILFLAGGVAKSVTWGAPAGEAIRIALLQGNVPQQLKWREEVRARTLVEYRDMVFAANAHVVVLPETALPAFIDQLPPDYVAGLRAHARESGKEILMGTVERKFRDGGEFDYFNSLVNLTDPAQAGYRKRHLVPFGEFIPPGFKWILAVLEIPLSDFAIPTEKPRTLRAAGRRFGAAICYEDIFGEEVIELLPEAEILVNVSNDAWFGESLAADQHLQTSQMRALETERWMVRATNTGVTAAIDERGYVVARVPQFTRATLVQAVPPRTGITPYVRWGDYGALALIALLAAAAFAANRRAR
jgi:apolipoprotein N-acyltransferase